MISSLTNTFGRDFLVGYLLPVFLSACASAGLAVICHGSAAASTWWAQTSQDVWAASAALVGLWLFSALLMVMNRPLIVLLEGYPFPWLNFLELRRFDRLQQEIEDLREKRKKEREQSAASLETNNLYRDLSLLRRNRFPLERGWVLATKFGNTMRAFETYSQAVYGLDAIPVWNRLYLLLPDQARKTLNDSKATLDFFVNSYYLLWILVGQLLIYAAIQGAVPWLLLVPVPLALISLVYRGAVSAAGIWGEGVKAVVDLYRYDLLEKLGVAIPATWEEERECWTKLSRTFLYWNQVSLERAKRTPEMEEPPKSPSKPSPRKRRHKKPS